MTTPVANPEPTTGSNRTRWHAPRAKDPNVQRFYDWLLDNGWRYSSNTVEWFTPESWGSHREERGRFSINTDHTEAWLERPWDGVTTTTVPGTNVEMPMGHPPLIKLVVDANGQVVETP